MKRLHVHLNVKDLDDSVKFYSNLFDTKPSVSKDVYAKWELDNPPVNFAISTQGTPGLQHLGIQATNKSELDELYQRSEKLDAAKLDEGETVCCYARSKKMWINDPQNVAWELFHTMGEAENFHVSRDIQDNHTCCEPSCCNG